LRNISQPSSGKEIEVERRFVIMGAVPSRVVSLGAALCALSVVPAVSLSQIPDVYDPSIPWQTRHGSLLCPSYFAIKDGEAAARSGDQNWLKQTGCIIAKGGLKIVLVDAPYNPHDSDGVWRRSGLSERHSGI
jgi:hypothetical protein